MDEDLIRQWNELITNEDSVYYLGDFAFKSKSQDIVNYLKKLNFNDMVVILGNHDNKSFRDATKHFNNIKFKWGDRIKVEGKLLYLSHFPMVIGERANIYSLHGHLHSTESPNPIYQINVGFDYTNKIAMSMEEVLEKANYNEKIKRGLKHL